MLQFGSITTGAAAASKWEYTGGTPPDNIQTIPTVKGIKNPLFNNTNFQLIFAESIFGTDYFGGFHFQDLSTLAFSTITDIGSGTWVNVQNVSDPSTLESVNQTIDKTQIVTIASDASGTEFGQQITKAGWRLFDTNQTKLFQVDQAGRIQTNQITLNQATNTHDFDLPIYDTAGTLKGYIKIYRPQ